MTGQWTRQAFERGASSRGLRALPVALLAACLHSAPLAAAPMTLVVCAPGYPGSTLEAQPAMDALAAALVRAAGWRPGELQAVYFENEQAGLERLAAADAALALVPLAFWLEHQQPLLLGPQLQAVQQGGEAAESWTLVAAHDAPTRAADLAGWEIVSLAGYAPRFVRGPAASGFGPLPAGVKVTFSPAVLSALRKAGSGGAKLAVLLDRSQAAALPSLPFASRLKTVNRSRALPVSVLCAVGRRIAASRLRTLTRAFLSLDTQAPEALAGIRMARFVAVDETALAAARAEFDRAAR